MFELSEKYQSNRRVLKCEYIRCSPSEISSINTPNSLVYNNLPRKDSVISLLYSYLATSNRYVDGDDIRLVNLSPIALFSIYKLASVSGKHLEEISHAHIVSLMYMLLTWSKDSDDFSLGFDRSRDRRKRELTNSKNNKGKYHVTVYLKDFFRFAEHQEVVTYDLSYSLV